MAPRRLALLTTLLALVGAAWLAPLAQAVPKQMIGLGVGADKNTLYGFSGSSLNTVSVTPVTGLGGATLSGISIRPATGQLYGLSASGNVVSLFVIDPASGAAAPVGSSTVTSVTGATVFGIAFNPVADRLRVIDNLASDGGGANANNFRLNPNNGALAGNDTDLNFGGLPGDNANAPLAEIAYDRNFAGATATTLFGIAAGGDRLVTIGGPDATPSANGGTLFDVGPLGLDVTTNAGFDVDPATGEAYAILESAGQSSLYRVDLATGAATSVGPVAGGVFKFGGLAIVPTPPEPVIPPEQKITPPAAISPPAPELLSLKIRPTAFAPAKSGGPILAKAAKPPRGATVTYSLSSAATVTFRVERAGRGSGKECATRTAANLAKKKCRIYSPLKPSFTHKGAAGTNSFRFSGRVGTTAIAPGNHRLVATVGTSTRSINFRVLPPPR